MTSGTRRSAAGRVLEVLLMGALVALALGVASAQEGVAGQKVAGGAIRDGPIYVDREATGANDGSSWASAFTDLQDGLDAAVSGDEIWVAAGTYYPSVEHGGTGDRYKSFQMVYGVAIYGGFDPSVGDVDWEDRDWANNVTILSGNLGAPGDDADNCYHVFYHPDGTGLDETAILDGFTIADGNADGSGDHENGGGMYNSDSSPTLANCAFAGNSAGLRGGGMCNDRYSSPTLSNCTFEGNSAAYGGGMYNYLYSSPTLTNCTFSGNSALHNGGGMNNMMYSSPTLTNCTFQGNYAIGGLGDGGGMFNMMSSSPTLTNCTFSSNSASSDGGAMYNSTSSPTLTNCILWGHSPNEIYNLSSSPVVTYSDVQGGYAGEGNINADPLWVDPDNGDYHLSEESPCIDAGTNDAPDLPPYDFEGDGRIMDGDGDGTAIVDMGVDEFCLTVPVTGLTATNDSPTALGETSTLTATVTAGSNVTYAWAFDDEAFGSGAVVNHTYPDVGLYTAVVTATNSVSQLTATTTVTVTDAPIEGLAATNDSPTLLGETSTLTATIAAGSNVTYTWAFDDGQFGSGAVVTHTYPDVGLYTAVVTATNSVSQLTATTTVTVTPPTFYIYLPLILRNH